MKRSSIRKKSNQTSDRKNKKLNKKKILENKKKESPRKKKLQNTSMNLKNEKRSRLNSKEKNRLKVFRKIDELMTLMPASAKMGCHINETDLGFIDQAAFIVKDDQFLWVGNDREIARILKNSEFQNFEIEEIDLSGSLVMPGFVECHTHTLFAGSRSHEFEMRLNGASYQEISKAGGGILSTVRETRKSTEFELQKSTQNKVNQFLKQGVTTLEIKTGYALSLQEELKCLKVIQSMQGPQIIPTFLGAHSVPPEFSSAEAYLKEIKNWLPQIKKLTDRCDIWIEKGFFEASFAKEFLNFAKELGFQIVIHADQLTLSGGSELAMELGARSADHVIQIKREQIKKFSKSDTIPVLLPAADFYMKCAYPPARELIDEGCCVALATDFNPGTCPTQDLAFVGLLARLEMKMTLPEVLSAYTVGAARALGRHFLEGSIEPNKLANFVVRQQNWTDLFYNVGDSYVETVYIKGEKKRVP